MKIGIDLDGVVFDSEKEFRVYSELYDILELKRNSIKNNKEIRCQNRYEWSKVEIDNFFKKYHEPIIEKANFIPGAEKVLKMLKEEGHELIIITARGKTNEEIIKITKRRLKETNMNIFDKYYWGIENKNEICKKENIDIMIDDFDKVCQSVANNKIKTIYFKAAESFDLEENEYIKVLYNWGEIYRYMRKMVN